jgi:hypothetical protein
VTAPTLTSAIAVPFAWTSSAPDIVLQFASGTSPVNVNVASGTYRMALAPALTDFLRVVQNAINAAVAGAGRSEVFTVSMGADSRITVSATGAFRTASLPVALAAMGFASNLAPYATSFVADVPPAFFATFVERVSQDWTTRTAVAGGETLSGATFGVYSGAWREEDEVTWGFIPRDPSTRTSLSVNQTPWLPAFGVTYGNHLGQWGIVGILASAGGKTCALAYGNLQTLLSSTTATYDLVALPFGEIAAPRKSRLRDGWDAYFRWTTRVIRQSTQTGTRA